MVVSASPKRWYISGIYCQLGDYIATYHLFSGTKNNHWQSRWLTKSICLVLCRVGVWVQKTCLLFKHICRKYSRHIATLRPPRRKRTRTQSILTSPELFSKTAWKPWKQHEISPQVSNITKQPTTTIKCVEDIFQSPNKKVPFWSSFNQQQQRTTSSSPSL